MSATDALVELLAQLRTNQALQAAFLANPSAAVEDFELTGHERDAVVTRDLDDFVALGLVSSISELPPVLRGEPGGSWIPDWLRRLVDRLLRRDRGPHVDPRPRPGPTPRPLPGPPEGPRPRPGPGPDPGPDP